MTEDDCGTDNGLVREAQVQGGEVVVLLSDRILGRFSTDDIIDPVTGEVLVSRDQMLDEDLVKLVDDANLHDVKVSSAVTCETRLWGVQKMLWARPWPWPCDQYWRSHWRDCRPVYR